jgi:hypothetical protein
MIEVSLFGFLVSGAFLGFANFDLFYQLVAMVVILKVLYRDEALAASHSHVAQPEPIELAQEALQ